MGCKELDMTEQLTLSYLTCIYLVSTMCLVCFHTVHGALKARILKWFAIPFSSGPCFDYAKAFDYVDHNRLWKILQEMEIPDHLTCFLRNLYAGQETTVRIGYGTLFNFFAE